MYKRLLLITISFLATLTLLFGCTDSSYFPSSSKIPSSSLQGTDEDGTYLEYTDVAAYIHTYSRLPANYITKEEAIKSGWISTKGNLWDVTDKKCIGGDVFGNREKVLPDSYGRVWYECDVNYYGGFRGGERIVYSNDGLIYYTKDHYETFTRLY